MRASLRRGTFRIPGLLIAFGMGMIVMGSVLSAELPTDPLDEELDCNSIRESRRKLRKCLDARDSQRLSRTRVALMSVDQYPSPIERDLLRMRLMAESPRLAETICASVETAEAERLCGRFERRPHLYAVEEGWVLREEAQGSRKGRSGTDGSSGGRSSRSK